MISAQTPSQTPTQINALDPRSLAGLQRLAREENSPEALHAAAKQFEALFLQMVVKAMREATPQDGLFDNEQTRLFQSLLDQQWTLQMAESRGVGLADQLFRQLGGEKLLRARELEKMKKGEPQAAGVEDADSGDALPFARRTPTLYPKAAIIAEPGTLAAKSEAVNPVVLLRRDSAFNLPLTADRHAVRALGQYGRAVENENAAVSEQGEGFVRRLWPHAQKISQETGIPAHFMVAQAALETGWGNFELKTAQGQASYNLFNIKAGSDWVGKTLSRTVKEYDSSGNAYPENARFRVYDSYEQSFRDYANLLRSNPRYAAVLDATDAHGFASSLQRAGYATDPLYASKLTRIINGDTLRATVQQIAQE